MSRRAGSAALAAGLTLAASQAAAAPDLGSERQREAGRELYGKYCAQCHGDAGDGNGHATPRLKPRPRDFTSGKYKFRTTPSGMLPTDADLARVIENGLPYTSMPAFTNLSEAEVQNLIYHLKTFSEDFANPDKYGDPIDIPEPPPVTEESIARGRVVYEEQGCAACHGGQGRGNGLSAPTLKDDWGHHIRPADMTQRWTFRGGPTRQDMFRTFSTGLNGTPMPSYFDSLAVEDRWHLVNYMQSLGDGDGPGYADLVRAVYVEDEIDTAAGREGFAAAPPARFPLIGQIVEPGRDFHPSTTSVEVRAVFNRNDIAFLLTWNDMRAETSGTNAPDLPVPPGEEDQPEAAAGDDAEEGDSFWGDEAVEDEGDVWGDEAVAEGEGEDDFWGEEEAADPGAGAAPTGFSDAVALQFPSALPAGVRKPYFLFGDAQTTVDLWFVDLARPSVRQYVGRGSANLEPVETDEFEVASGYDDGTWWVVLKRELGSTANVSFTENPWVPVAFSVWDGFNGERGAKRALSRWVYVHVEPIEEVSKAGPVARAAAGALVLELALVFWIRRRFGRAGGERVGRAVPQGTPAGPSR
jgi:mono/diheme cytochrome c family protein